jgi:hypothetical protein
MFYLPGNVGFLKAYRYLTKLNTKSQTEDELHNIINSFFTAFYNSPNMTA